MSESVQTSARKNWSKLSFKVLTKLQPSLKLTNIAHCIALNIVQWTTIIISQSHIIQVATTGRSSYLGQPVTWVDTMTGLRPDSMDNKSHIIHSTLKCVRHKMTQRLNNRLGRWRHRWAECSEHPRRRLKILRSRFPLTKCMRLCMLTIFTGWYIVRHETFFPFLFPRGSWLLMYCIYWKCY